MMKCCFIGHRQLRDKSYVELKLRQTILSLLDSGVDSFMFGSKGEFNDLAYDVLNAVRIENGYNFKIVYIRAEYPNANEEYCSNLLNYYDEIYMPPHLGKAGRAVYVLRNYYMIDRSDIVVVYLEDVVQNNSGTQIAFNYAKKKNKQIINVAK